MDSAVIPILPAGGASCGACLHSAAGPVCRVEVGQPCEAPDLSGPPEQISRVMRELTAALGTQGQGGSHFVRALRLGDGEAQLTMAVAPHCAGAELADIAFQTLRRLLPDTDIYVVPAAG